MMTQDCMRRELRVAVYRFHRKRGYANRDDVVVLGEVANTRGNCIEICNEGAVDQIASAREHLREDAFRADAVDP